jgi:hypothetical protein
MAENRKSDQNLGLQRLAETTIGGKPIGRKPQLVDVKISRKHDWPKADEQASVLSLRSTC